MASMRQLGPSTMPDTLQLWRASRPVVDRRLGRSEFAPRRLAPADCLGPSRPFHPSPPDGISPAAEIAPSAALAEADVAHHPPRLQDEVAILEALSARLMATPNYSDKVRAAGILQAPPAGPGEAPHKGLNTQTRPSPALSVGHLSSHLFTFPRTSLTLGLFIIPSFPVAVDDSVGRAGGAAVLFHPCGRCHPALSLPPPPQSRLRHRLRGRHRPGPRALRAAL